MTNPKKHHYLPQFYLRGFQKMPQKSKYEKIWLVMKNHKTHFILVNVKDTGCETDYHTIDPHHGEVDRKTVESNLSEIESIHASMLRQIFSEESLSKVSQQDLITFVSLMRFRVPAFKEIIEKTALDSVSQMSKIMERNGELPPMPEELVRLGKSFSEIAKIKISNWFIMQNMFSTAFSDKNLGLLSNMEASLVKAPEGSFFITSDTPVALFDPKLKGKVYGSNIIDRDIVLTLALNSELLLYMSWEKKESFWVATRDEVDEFNRRSIIMSERNIYSTYDNDDILALVKANCDVKAGFESTVLDHGDGAYIMCQFTPVTH